MAAARLQMMLHDLSLSLSLSLFVHATHSAHFFCRLRFDYIFLMITTTETIEEKWNHAALAWRHESGKLRVGRNLNVMQA